jgi:hypothetical protein
MGFLAMSWCLEWEAYWERIVRAANKGRPEVGLGNTNRALAERK